MSPALRNTCDLLNTAVLTQRDSETNHGASRHHGGAVGSRGDGGLWEVEFLFGLLGGLLGVEDGAGPTGHEDGT